MIPVVEKPMCKLIPSSLARLVFANLDSAVIRIKAELERCPPQKVRQIKNRTMSSLIASCH